MSVSNLLVPNNDNILSNTLDVNYITNKSSMIVATVSPVSLLPSQAINNLIINQVSGTDLNIYLPSAASVLKLLPNAQVNTTFWLNFVNYSATNYINVLASLDGTFTVNTPNIIVTKANTSGQVSRVCYAVFNTVGNSPTITLY